MKQRAEAKLAAKSNAQGPDAEAIKTWERSLDGKMPLFFTNTAAKQTLEVAVAAYQELSARHEALKVKSAAKPAVKPAVTSPAAKPVAPVSELTGFARVSASFAKKSAEGPPVITRDAYEALSDDDKADFHSASGQIR